MRLGIPDNAQKMLLHSCCAPCSGAILECLLETGEALVSFLGEKGAPSVVERARILFPLSQIGAITEAQRGQIISQSLIAGKYDRIIDRPPHPDQIHPRQPDQEKS